MLFKNDNLKVSRLETKDNHLLAKWLSDPQVLEFYEGRDNPLHVEKVNQKFYNQGSGVVGCMVRYKEVDIGYIQYYAINEETSVIDCYDSTANIYGMDQFIGETDYWNKGVGTLLVMSMVTYLIEVKQADNIIMDPQISNERAIKCYEKCGFHKAKILPKHEFHEGEYRDCWLMEFKNKS